MRLFTHVPLHQFQLGVETLLRAQHHRVLFAVFHEAFCSEVEYCAAPVFLDINRLDLVLQQVIIQEVMVD